jgi:hypothetical protein
MEETIEHLFRFVEEKIIGLEMLLKNGYGVSKNHDQQLTRKVDFYVIDYEIYKFKKEDAITHIVYLIGKIHLILNNDLKLTKLAKMDEMGLEFSKLETVKDELKAELNLIAKHLLKYKEILDGRNLTDIQHKLKSTFVSELLLLRINYEELFIFETEQERLQLSKNLEYFLNEKFEKINPAINFCTQKRQEYFAYYVINRIADYFKCNKKDIKNISVNGTPYSENSRQRHSNRIKTKLDNKTDILFESFCDSFEDAIKLHII